MKTLVRLLTLIVALAILSGCGAPAQSGTPEETTPAGIEFVKNEDPCKLYYDDVVDLTAEPFKAAAGSTVTISEQTVTSKQVAGGAPDTDVLVYDADTLTLYAAGVGTATLTIDGTDYAITVSPAPINVFFIGGHSVSAGVGGDPELSVACPAGQVYSTYESYITAKVNENWGWEYNWSLSKADPEDLSQTGIGHNAENRPETIDALTAGNTGTYGSGSGIAYRWNQLTGEKVWLVNCGHGGAGLDEWWEGAVDYVHTVKLMKNVLTILKNEIAAGHYTFARMEMFYFSCANGDQDWEPREYKDAFDSMYLGFKQDICMDVDGDGTEEIIDNFGLIPHWRPAGNTIVDPAFNNGQSQNYYIAASAEYPDVYLASSLCRSFDSIAPAKIAGIFTTDYLQYPTQNGTTPAALVPDSMKNSDTSVFPDTIHCAQVVQNLQGMIAAESLYKRLTGTGVGGSVAVYAMDGINTLADGHTLKVAAYSKYRLTITQPDHVLGSLRVEATGNIRYDGVFVTASAAGSGKLTIYSGERVVHTIHFEVN